MRILTFTLAGKTYRVNEQGHINANGIGYYSPRWEFLGGSPHHWHRRITVSLHDAFENPARLNGCLGWDRDHGTVRQWGGRYCGTIPRIYSAHIVTK
jgi:hypothetical protein